MKTPTYPVTVYSSNPNVKPETFLEEEDLMCTLELLDSRHYACWLVDAEGDRYHFNLDWLTSVPAFIEYFWIPPEDGT
jgi:hypothetical protein